MSKRKCNLLDELILVRESAKKLERRIDSVGDTQIRRKLDEMYVGIINTTNVELRKLEE